MLKTRLTATNKGATIKAPNEPTEGSGPRAKPHPFLSVEYIASSAGRLDKVTLADPKCCPNTRDRLNLTRAVMCPTGTQFLGGLRLG